MVGKEVVIGNPHEAIAKGDEVLPHDVYPQQPEMRTHEVMSINSNSDNSTLPLLLSQLNQSLLFPLVLVAEMKSLNFGIPHCSGPSMWCTLRIAQKNNLARIARYSRTH